MKPEWMYRCFYIHPLEDHLLSNSMILTQHALSPGRPKHAEAPFCHQQMAFSLYALYKTIFWVNLSFWPNKLYPGTLEWMCWGFSVSVINALYKTIFQAYDIDTMSVVSQETWTMKVQRLPSVSDVKPYFPEDLNEYAEVFLCEECPFKNHLPSKPIILTQQALSLRRPEWTCRGFPEYYLQDQFSK